MSEKLVANPYLEINDEKIEIYGNSLSYDPGYPTINVTAMSAGGGTSTTLHAVDVTTMVGMVKFKLPATGKTDRHLSTWKANIATNVIKFYEDDLEKTLFGASYADGRDIELSASEGGIEVTFKGDPM